MGHGAERLAFSGLTLLAVLLTSLAASFGVAVMPIGVLVVPIFIGGLLLRPRLYGVLLVEVAALLAYVISVDGWRASRVGDVIAIAVVALGAAGLPRARERLGFSVTGRGEAMLLRLRDQLAHQSRLPTLPPTWHADLAQQQAGGASFGGDFLVATTSADGRRLEVAVVDVSGKGADAGTRALLLSGAFGGLLSSVPPEQFLPAANVFLLRQQWPEGFATAVHVSIDLTSGRYQLFSAGHPPPAQLFGGSGTWKLLDCAGTALGVTGNATVGAYDGALAAGDALMLYTDGVVESPGRDFDAGIDRLIGAADQLIPHGGFSGSATRLLRQVTRTLSDDRALLLLWRD
jgi:serine phosphatase RsbU (regulator of sigma subunit)